MRNSELGSEGMRLSKLLSEARSQRENFVAENEVDKLAVAAKELPDEWSLDVNY